MREDRGANVQNAGAKHELVFSNARPHGSENAKRPVLGRGSGRFVRNGLRPQVIRMKAVVRDQHNGGVFPSQLEQSAEHHVMVAIAAFHNILVELEVLLRNPIPASAGGTS